MAGAPQGVRVADVAVARRSPQAGRRSGTGGRRHPALRGRSRITQRAIGDDRSDRAGPVRISAGRHASHLRPNERPGCRGQRGGTGGPRENELAVPSVLLVGSEARLAIGAEKTPSPGTLLFLPPCQPAQTLFLSFYLSLCLPTGRTRRWKGERFGGTRGATSRSRVSSFDFLCEHTH